MSCGRAGYNPLEILDGSSEDAAAATDAPLAVDAAPSAVGDPLLYIDAENVDGAGSPGSQNCPASGPSAWSDLASVEVGNLVNGGTPPCSPSSGWSGSGTPADPHRLTLAAGSNSAVNFGTIAETSHFTVEAWVRWSGGGVASTTGSGGIDVYPLVAKGAAEVEATEGDENYYLAIDQATGAVAGDFEDSVNHDNHPIVGVTPLVAGDWYHLAMTYDEVQEALFVNGVVDALQGETDPASLSIDSFVGVGAAIETDGGLDGGFFEGDIAIVRIFNRALSTAEILVECEAFASRFEGLSCGP
jgi:tetrahydromethanopterin S-methyltransferase subunit B